MDDGGVTVQDTAIADAATMLGIERGAPLGRTRVGETEDLVDDAARGGWFIPSALAHRLAAAIDLPGTGPGHGPPRRRRPRVSVTYPAAR